MRVFLPWKRVLPSLGVVREKTKIVLARNLSGLPFPSSRFFRPVFAEEVKTKVTEVITREGREWKFASEERSDGALLFLRQEKHRKIGVLVNGEDHLRIFLERMSSLCRADFESVQRLDRFLERFLDYAFDPQWGYLTASSQWMGTGLRIFLWLHLPALSFVYGEHQLLQWFRERPEIVVSGCGGAKEPVAHVFEVTNRYTLGVTEREIFEWMSWIERKVVRWERSVRDVLRGSDLHRRTLLEKLREVGKDIVRDGDTKDKKVLDFLSLLCLGQEEGIFPQGRGCNGVSTGSLVEKGLQALPLRGMCGDILEFLGVPLGRIRDDV
ncbi:hypothetical protein [Candidatus Caldatribacterium sp.]|uniref:hypothetical protein n=1 Tax=Candidatus Caldatribacterium sp. TaxID=2282143 RepID=UPI0029915BE1|nr:hypothetical protein [Candidatus Calescibacterium sp.]